MAIDLFSKKFTDKNWSRVPLTEAPGLPDTTHSRLDDVIKVTQDELRDTKVSFRGKGAVVSRTVRF
jgi:hypothetical protein